MSPNKWIGWRYDKIRGINRNREIGWRYRFLPVFISISSNHDRSPLLTINTTCGFCVLMHPSYRFCHLTGGLFIGFLCSRHIAITALHFLLYSSSNACTYMMLSSLKPFGEVIKQAGCWANAHFLLHLHKSVDTKPEWKQAMPCLLKLSIKEVNF